ncbi:arginine--tRNA ligase [Paenibacillus chitinolyticus]|uniref:arginine--tRNA ligase n=1 Tax=Paenibacillus chitinolyticus TaxID=79263 RepID=UPI001C4821E4|nr:arginine--tRNA ligase [Paenibacillus chitinolyticus]MBV6714425.1 arginine--tRNA ligase [Paenibacillus chitinolyticus]
MISTQLSDEIERQVRKLLDETGTPWPAGIKVLVDKPAHPEHGEYSTNVAMLLAKSLKKPPMEIAEKLKMELEHSGIAEGIFSKVEAAPPGFLNFAIDWSAWMNRHREYSAYAGDGGKGKVMIEHTSINPNKSAHIGHLRNSCIGDTLARLLSRAGREVEIHNYIDDLGNQLADTVVGILHTKTEGKHVCFGDFCWDTYAKVNRMYKEEPGLQEERTRVLHELEEGNSSTAWIGRLTAEKIVREQLHEMKAFGIGYDVLVWESRIVAEGLWEAAFEHLQATEAFYKVEEGKLAGCWVLRHGGERSGEAEGASNPEPEAHQADKVLVRSNGILTYTAKDIAYHLWKFGLLSQDFTYMPFAEGVWSTDSQGYAMPYGRGETVINVIDYRQEYPQTMVKLALEALGYKEQAARLLHVSYGVVSLSPETAESLGVDTSAGKGSYAMSGRQGVGIKVAELLHVMDESIESKRSRQEGLSSREIAAAAIRYYLLKYHLQTEVVFDLRQATEVSGNSGVYLLYAYARAGSVLEKAAAGRMGSGKALMEPPVPSVDGGALEPPERQLLKQIAYWTETMDAAVRQLAPNLICSYAFELSLLFNNFYGACPILKGPADRVELRVWLTWKFRETLGKALDVLGLPAPERM